MNDRNPLSSACFDHTDCKQAGHMIEQKHDKSLTHRGKTAVSFFHRVSVWEVMFQLHLTQGAELSVFHRLIKTESQPLKCTC